MPHRTCRAQNERKLRTLGELSLELESCVPFVLQYGVMPSSVQLLEAGRPDLAQAIKACDALVIPTHGPWQQDPPCMHAVKALSLMRDHLLLPECRLQAKRQHDLHRFFCVAAHGRLQEGGSRPGAAVSAPQARPQQLNPLVP